MHLADMFIQQDLQVSLLAPKLQKATQNTSAINCKSIVLTKMMPLKINIIVFKNPKQPIFTVSDIPETDIHGHELI